MPQFKLLLLDIDGTTVESRGDALPSPRVIEAIRRAREHVHVAPATGRPFPLTRPVIEALQLQGLGVFNGGAEIVDMDTGKIVHEVLLSVEALHEAIAIALPFGFPVYTDDDEYGKILESPEEVTIPAAKLLIERVEVRELPALLEALSAVMGIAAHPTSSWSSGDVVDVHVTHEHATKRYGVERLIEMLGVKKEEVIAAGDSFNDIPLLEAAGTKIVIGTAPEEVRALADFVAPSLKDDGLAVAIEKYLL